MSESGANHMANHEFDEVVQNRIVPFEKLAVDDLKGVRVSITADLGQSGMLVREVLELKRGSVVALDKLAGEMTDIYANGMLLARGEVVVIADSLHVRIGEIHGAVSHDKDQDDE